jgi:putative DNA primase/helicase
MVSIGERSRVQLRDVAAQAAARLNLIYGRDNIWRGRCPACGYAKPTLELGVQCDRIEIRCIACGADASIARMIGLPNELVVAPTARPSKVARAPGAWRKAVSMSGTLVESYLQGRGIISPPNASIRFLPRQRNWIDGNAYPAMISLVQRLPNDDERGLQSGALLIDAGAHFTFLQGGGFDEPVRKAATDACKLTLGQLRHGGVWLTPVNEIKEQLAVAEGIETALSVRQITNVPTVAALSAAGMRSFRWLPWIRRLWIAADNDEVGRGAAEALLARALRAGLQAHIKLPAQGKNDFNDLLMSA